MLSVYIMYLMDSEDFMISCSVVKFIEVCAKLTCVNFSNRLPSFRN